MKKYILLLTAAFFIAASSFAQADPALRQEKLAQAKEEIKVTLVSKLALSEAAAGKVVGIESEFHQRLEAIAALGNIPTKDKEVKLNEAHTARRASLLAVPLSGRQMEDAVELTDGVWRKYGL